MTPNLVIFGRQGSGKGTQAVNIAQRYGCVHVSTGDMLRAAVSAGTPLGLKAQSVMDAGQLVPDDLMNGIVADRLMQDDIVAHGFLLDGFPRTTAQAEELERMLNEAGSGVTVAINLDVPVSVVTERMMARGRADDTEEAIAQRLALYEEQTRPLAEWFDERGLFETVDGVGTEEEVFDRLVAIIDARIGA